ncbi:MAG TPA: hypothetical protein VF228_18750, partial [Iamia sp.]
AWQDSTSGALGDAARSVTYPVALAVGPDPADRTGALANVLAVLVAPVLGIVALVLLERVRTLLSGLVRWRTLIDRRGQLDEVRARRAEVVEATLKALR